jgi:hypothetical protein
MTPAPDANAWQSEVDRMLGVVDKLKARAAAAGGPRLAMEPILLRRRARGRPPHIKPSF